MKTLLQNLRKASKHVFSSVLLIISSISLLGNGSIIPTDDNQEDFLKAYKLILYRSYIDLRFTGSNYDSELFPLFGEFSIYWAKEGANKGSFILPETVPSNYSTVSYTTYTSYNWKAVPHYSIQYKPHPKRIAIFRSKIKENNNTVSWGAIYFKNLFDSYLFDDIYYFIDEDYLDSNEINSNTQLVIIPSFILYQGDNKFYIDQSFSISPKMKDRFKNYLKQGGLIYTEGNAAYFIEKLGYLENGAIDFNNYEEADYETNLIDIKITKSDNPIAFTSAATAEKLWTTIIPKTQLPDCDIIAKTKNKNYPAVFYLSGQNANNGKIVCNLGMPTIGGLKDLSIGSRQLQWSLNTILFTFAKNLDVTRSIWNDLPDTLTAGKNAVSYDREDEFEVRILIRNLSNNNLTSIQITENIREFFSFVKMKTSNIEYEINGSNLIIKNINLAPGEEKIITYILKTPEPESKFHENVNKYISWSNYIYASYSTIQWQENNVTNTFLKYRNYVEIMFSAFLVADTDLNWKNILYPDYQPFKVFMIMENKERTPAVNTEYVQYIPKDVPFYWSDHNINIPILRTPGGKYVDILKGSNDQKNPEFDMDSDGYPDAWLDTASIYPKGYTITEEEVYWLNPWEHLRNGNKLLYEDIDHDGLRAIDSDGDGIVDVEEPGDKIRVWKVTWNIDRIAGYEVFDPYCYYEIWVDPPDLVPLSAGVGKAYGLLENNYKGGKFYPYTPNIDNANLKDTSWTHWMERDKNGKVIWKQLIYQKINNYEGFTFIDTAATGYKLNSNDYCAGTVPQPHREYIAVLSLGGEEIDMEHYKPSISRYSNLKYKTIFGEERTYPIRTTYTYWTPLPNPLQFEYLTNCFTITNDAGDTLKYLPKHGKVNLTFDIDASTEYSYYWIRNVGHDVDYNDPSEAIEKVEKLGDGVFGYFVYDIPKGVGGYKIHLPKKDDGSYDINKIVQIDGKPYTKWLDNPNTKNEVEIYEDAFQYHIYIPQILIPPALDDDNFDGIDDWIDDRGDRFQSKSGYLHDNFMLDNGEDWPNYPVEPFKDDIYGWVTSGWYHGSDGTYGDDFFENLGKTHIKIHCQYEGLGKEGSVDISKGGWLVVEEIFGGSPWVIFSHVLSGFATGTDLKLTAKANPSVVKYGLDTCYIKFTITDEGEPHNYDINFDPYHVSFGYGETSITTHAGGKDPCNLIKPAINMSTIIDPDFDKQTVTLIPYADASTNPELTGYPKTETGSFLEIKIEIMNGTNDNWINTTVTPVLPPELKKSEIVMSYVAYPRPLVPAQFDPATGEIIQGGDDLGSFRAGWRFNQPEGEVLIKIGNQLPLLQPSRRAYFIFLLKVDNKLQNGTYDITFNLSGTRQHYDEKAINRKKEKAQAIKLNYEIPPLKFAISNRDDKGNVLDYQKFIIGTADLKELVVYTTDYFKGLGETKWSTDDINNTDFDSLTNTLPAFYNQTEAKETINLKQFKQFPSKDLSQFYILERGIVNSYGNEGDVLLSENQTLNYDEGMFGQYSTKGQKVEVSTIGPKLMNFKMIHSVNGKNPKSQSNITFEKGQKKDIETMLQITNYGNDVAQMTDIEINIGKYYLPIIEKLPENYQYLNGKIYAKLGSILPGDKKRIFLHFTELPGVCDCMYDTSDVIPEVNINYIGKMVTNNDKPLVYKVEDKEILNFDAPDLRIYDLSSSKSRLAYNSTTQITAKIQNGVTPVENVTVQIFARTNKTDQIFIGEESFDKLDKYEKKSVTISYTITDTLEYIEFYAVAKSQVEGSEFCEQNNYKELKVPFEGPNWIIDVKNFPNPATYKTYLNYYLPRQIKELTLRIFNFDGKEVAVISNCPTEIGQHNVLWKCPDDPKGTYIYIFEGIDENGARKIHKGVLVKD